MPRQSLRRRRQVLDGCTVLQSRVTDFASSAVEVLVEHQDLPRVAGDHVPIYKREMLDDGRMVFERIA